MPTGPDRNRPNPGVPRLELDRTDVQRKVRKKQNKKPNALAANDAARRLSA